MIFNYSRFLSFILQIFIEHVLCAFAFVSKSFQKIRNYLRSINKIYRNVLFGFSAKVTRSISDRAEIQIHGCQMLQPMKLSIRSSSSSDSEKQRMALTWVEGMVQGILLWQKVSLLVLGSNTNKPLLFCGITL